MSIFRMISFPVAALTLAGLLGCGEGGPAAPKGGSPEWHWDNASYYYEKSDFSKMSGELVAIADRETPLNGPARVWRTVLLLGLSKGYLEIGDAYRAAIEQSPDTRQSYEGPLQQVNRDARQYAIELAESLGELDKAWGTGEVVCQFPFPPGSADVAPVFEGMKEGQDVGKEQVAAAAERTVYRGVVLAATEFCGFGEGPEFAEKAQTAFQAGPVTVSNDDARFKLAKMLLDASLVFTMLRVDEPKVRDAMIDRSEDWIKPYLESENEELKARAEAFAEEIEDERRDMRKKVRLKKMRE